MAIVDYNSLVSAVGRFLYRDTDPDITNRAQEFVSLAEARIRRNQEWFVQQYTLTAASGGNPLNVTVNPIQLPAMTKLLAVWASQTPWYNTIEILSPEAWRDLVSLNNNASGIPSKGYVSYDADTLVGTGPNVQAGPKLFLWPAPAINPSTPYAIDFKYISDLAPLSLTNTSNPLLLRHPDVYLYGALVESAPYYQADERLPMWEQKYQAAVKEINIERERLEYGASAKRPRLPRVF